MPNLLQDLKTFLFLLLVFLVTFLAGYCLELTARPKTDLEEDLKEKKLPAAYYLEDDVRYHPQGAELELWREAEELRNARIESDRK